MNCVPIIMHGASSEISGLLCCITFGAVTPVLMKIQVFWDVTPCWLVNTDIFEELAATTFRVYPRRLKWLSTMWFDHGNCIGQICKWVEPQLAFGFQISCDTSKGVICYNLFVLSTYKGSTEMAIHVTLEQLECFAYPFK